MDTWGKSLAGGIAKAEVLTRMPGQRLPSNRAHGLPPPAWLRLLLSATCKATAESRVKE